MATTTSRPAKTTSKKSSKPAAKQKLLSSEDLLSFIFVGDPQMSPDGTRVLFMRKHTNVEKNRYETNLWLTDASGRSTETVQRFTASGQDRHGRWFQDGSHIAFIRGDRESGTQQVFLIPADGGEAIALTDFPEGSISSFRVAPDGTSIAVAFRETAHEFTKKAETDRKESHASTPPVITDNSWYRLDGDGYFGSARYALYLVDVTDRTTRKVYDKDNLGDFSFAFSPDSKQIAIATNRSKRSLFDAWNNDILLMNAKTGKVVRELKGLPRGPKDAVQFSHDGQLLAFAGREGEDSSYSTENLSLWVCDAKTGSNPRDLLAGSDICLMAATLSDTSEASFDASFTWHPDGTRLVFRLGWHGEGRIASVWVKNAAITTHIAGAFDHSIGSFDADGKQLAVMRSDAVTLPEIGIAKLTASGGSVAMRTSFNAALLKSRALARPTEHWLTSADGTKVHVWVMLPPGTAASKRLPGVLEIHGGPHAQYGVGFFHEFQVLASAGYCVVYANPRGSKGYGRDHCHAIRGAWGTADWVDMQAVIDFMQEHPQIDPKRMGVMGGSYGGYMTNWIIGNSRAFAGAITDRCVSNMVSMWGNSDYPLSDRYWDGNAWDNIDALWQSSPMKHMGKARTPTLIIHSEGDLRCNIEQAEQVFNVLQTKRVPSRFVRYPRSTSHGLSHGGPPDLRLHRLGEILAWWKKYLR
ncbi:MAG: prolyl oligopeptidase family serine peptidase [Phycisphaerales bacterium]